MAAICLTCCGWSAGALSFSVTAMQSHATVATMFFLLCLFIAMGWIIKGAVLYYGTDLADSEAGYLLLAWRTLWPDPLFFVAGLVGTSLCCAGGLLWDLSCGCCKYYLQHDANFYSHDPEEKRRLGFMMKLMGWRKTRQRDVKMADEELQHFDLLDGNGQLHRD